MQPTSLRACRHKPRWRSALAATVGVGALLGGAILGGVGALGASAAENTGPAATASASPSESPSAVSASPSTASASPSAEQSQRNSSSATPEDSQAPRARSAALSCTAGSFYTIDRAGSVYGVTSSSNTPNASATSTGMSFGNGSGQFNGLAIGSSGTSAYAFNRTYSESAIAIYAWTPSGTRTWTGALPGQTGLSYSSLIAGGVSPVDSSGKYYFGGYTSTNSGGTRFQLFSYSYNASATSSAVTYVGYVQIRSDTSDSNNGDLAFDAQGNLYILWNNADAGASRLVSVTASALQNHQSGQPLPAGSTRTITSAKNAQYNGLAFNNTGAVFIQYSASSSTYVAAINPDTGEYVSSVVGLSGLGSSTQGVDLASCQTPPTIQGLRKDVVGRVADTDQFALSITRQGQSDATATATTSGNQTGIQSELAGPIVAQAGATYLLEETGAGTPNALLSNYASTLSCVDTANNNATVPVAGVNGSTTKYSMTIPTSSPAAAVVCTFRNTPTSGSVTWTKTDASGAALGGSTWGLSETDGSGQSTETTVEDNTGQSGYTGLDTDPAAGKFTVASLPLGTYSLRETAAPQGYQLSQENHPFALTGSAPNYRFLTGFVNTQALGSATWTKTDSSGHELAGSEWTLTSPDDSKKIVTDNTGQSGYTGLDTDPAPGKFHVIDLAWGQYSLAESKAPAGYLVSETATATFTVDASHLEHALGTFKNPIITTPALPLTGGLGTDRFLFAGLGILLLAVLTGATVLIVRRRALH